MTIDGHDDINNWDMTWNDADCYTTHKFFCKQRGKTSKIFIALTRDFRI